MVPVPLAALFLLAATSDAPASASAAGRPASTKWSSTVETDRSMVTAGSPVLARMTLRNDGARAVELTEPLDELYGTAAVEIRRPGQKSFSIVPTAYTGLKQLEGYRSSISKGETVAAHVLLLTDARGRWVFDEAGRYELRARMRVRGQEVVSPAVAVEVRSADPDLKAKLAALQEDLSHVSVNEALDPERLARLRSGLANLPEFRSALLLVEAVTLIHRSNASEQADGAARLEKLRGSREAVWKGLATALLARHFARTGNEKEARRLLAALPFRSRISDQARDILAGVAGEKREGKPLPRS